jgi:protein TonB
MRRGADMAIYLAPNLQLPWSSSEDDDNRYQRILRIALGVVIVLIIIVGIINVPEIPREEKEKLPPQLARVVLEKQELPPPPVIEPPKVEEKKPEEIKPEEKKPIEKKPEPKPVEKPPEPVKTVERARENAKVSGLLQFQDDLMEMRDAIDTSAIENSNNLARGEATAAQVDRSAVTSGMTGTSGGINNAALSRDTGGVALSGRETTQVKSELASATRKAAETGTGNGEGGKTRSEEEMSKVMDQHKGAIFQIYNRALRQNAALQGRVVMNIIIEPSGQVTDVAIVTSELKDPELEAALIRRIKMITFPASGTVIRTTLRQTFDFLPQ